MRRRLIASAIASAAVLAATVPAQAAPGPLAGTGKDQKDDVVYLSAKLSGRKELPAKPGEKAAGGDADGRAVLEVRRDRVKFYLEWNSPAQLTLGHLHEAPEGVNGPVVQALFASAMPETVDAASGSVKVSDPAFVKRLIASPAGFYVNLHSTLVPGGAMRGQLAPYDPCTEYSGKRGHQQGGKYSCKSDMLYLGGYAYRSDLSGSDNRTGGVAYVTPQGKSRDGKRARVGYGIGHLGFTPGAMYLRGPGRDGGEANAPLFTIPLPVTVISAKGHADVDPDLVEGMRRNPKGYYAAVTPAGSLGQVKGSSLHQH